MPVPSLLYWQLAAHCRLTIQTTHSQEKLEMGAVLHYLPRWVVATLVAVNSVSCVRDRHVVGRHSKRGRGCCLWQGGGSNSQEVQGHVLHLLTEYWRDGVHGCVCAVQLADRGVFLHLSGCYPCGVPLVAASGAEPCAHEDELVMEMKER